jgi:hypothetical protein
MDGRVHTGNPVPLHQTARFEKFFCLTHAYRKNTEKPLTTIKLAGIPYGMNEKDGVIFRDIRRTFKTDMLNAGVWIKPIGT